MHCAPQVTHQSQIHHIDSSNQHQEKGDLNMKTYSNRDGKVTETRESAMRRISTGDTTANDLSHPNQHVRRAAWLASDAQLPEEPVALKHLFASLCPGAFNRVCALKNEGVSHEPQEGTDIPISLIYYNAAGSSKLAAAFVEKLPIFFDQI